MDGIPAEIYKAGGPVTPEMVHGLLINILEEGDMPKDLKDATVVPLFKYKAASGK